jgi:hypothetical protein
MPTTRRVVLGAVAGALTAFVWGGLSHMVLMRGVGFNTLPDDARVIEALDASIEEDGLYFFPSPDFSATASAEENAAWERRFAAGPTGMILFHPDGGTAVSPRKLAIQFIGGLVAATIAAYLASRSIGSWLTRALGIALMGAFGAASLGSIAWNWYGFPTPYFLAQCIDMTVGWGLAGLVIARIVPPPLRP